MAKPAKQKIGPSRRVSIHKAGPTARNWRDRGPVAPGRDILGARVSHVMRDGLPNYDRKRFVVSDGADRDLVREFVAAYERLTPGQRPA